MQKMPTIVLALVTLLVFVTYGHVQLNPTEMGEMIKLTPEGIAGLNSIRADVGALFLSTGLFCVLGLSTGNKQWLLAGAIPMGATAFGRIIGYCVEGYSPETLVPLLYEVVVSTTLVILSRQKDTTTA